MDEQRYWFPAKRYGWGWGIPRTWQGWVVLAVYAVLLAVGFLMYLPNDEIGYLLAYATLLTALLIAICWLKGEPPRWRWGDGEDA